MPLGNAKAQIEAIKAGLDCPMGNPQLPGNVYIFASFQEEVDDLLFAAGESCCPDVPGLFSKPGNPSSRCPVPMLKRFGMWDELKKASRYQSGRALSSFRELVRSSSR